MSVRVLEGRAGRSVIRALISSLAISGMVSAASAQYVSMPASTTPIKGNDDLTFQPLPTDQGLSTRWLGSRFFEGESGGWRLGPYGTVFGGRTGDELRAASFMTDGPSPEPRDQGIVVWEDGTITVIPPAEGWRLNSVVAAGRTPAGEQVFAGTVAPEEMSTIPLELTVASMDDSSSGYMMSGPYYRAARWIGGMQYTLPAVSTSPYSYSGDFAYGMSDDGSVVVGQSEMAGMYDRSFSQASYWRCSAADSCMGDVLPVPADSEWSLAIDADLDGSVIVGVARGESYIEAPARWDWSGSSYQYQQLALPDGEMRGYASAVSADGNVIVGFTNNSLNGTLGHAVQWRDNGAPQVLDRLGGNESQAWGVDGTGASIVGFVTVAPEMSDDMYSRRRSEPHAVRWSADGSGEFLLDFLKTNGVDMGDWRLFTARGITADGQIIIGTGSSMAAPDEEMELFKRYDSGVQDWLIYLPTPEMPAMIPIETLQNSFGSVSGSTGLGANIVHINALQHFDSGFRNGDGGSGGGTEPNAFAPFGEGSPFDTLFGNSDGTSGWRAYGYVDGKAGSDGFGNVTGNVGLSRRFGGGFVAGFGGGYSQADSDLALGGGVQNRAWFGNAFAGYVPDYGFQGLFSTTYGALSADIERGYVNGVTPVTSTGETNGYVAGFEARVGYRLPVGAFDVTPYGSYTLTHVHLDGYTETTGPMPASFSDIKSTSHITRLGAEGRTQVSSTATAWASVAWAHEFEPTMATVVGTIGTLSFNGTPVTRASDWAEVGAGVQIDLSDTLRLNVSGSLDIYTNGNVIGSGLLGFVKSL